MLGRWSILSVYQPMESSELKPWRQLMKQPHGRWIQRSENTNTGVTAVESKVR